MTVHAAAPPPAPAVVPPRWGYHASIIQRHQPAFWLLVIVLVITGWMNLGEQLTILQAFPAAWFFSWLLLVLWMVPVVLAIYILDQFEREPIPIMVTAFLWGAVASTGLAIVANTAWFEILQKLFGAEFTQTWGPALVAPVIEETIKYLGLVLIALIASVEIDDLFDGFVYGAMVGLGFAAVENVTYFVRPVVALGGADQFGPVFQMYLLRVVFSGFYMHVLWTGLTGIGIAYYLTRRDKPRQHRLLVAAGLFLAGVSSHFVWNSPLFTSILAGNPGPVQMITFGLLKGAPFLGFLAILIVLAQRRERRWFEIATADEAGSDVLTREEVATLGNMRSRFRARRAMGHSHGPGAGKLLGRLQREQINLAMVRTRVGDPSHPDVMKQREEIRSLRVQLAAIPALPVAPILPAGPAAGVPSMAASAPQGVVTGVWAPTHRVPDSTLQAWAAPDPSRPPIATLAARLDVRLVERTGDWARVVASNGWTGWVDARLLLILGE
ncbi:MAG: PrsW family glutamic-type intramembrane protease [Chloroflexota bacterium]|nr:PrsW family glutamic-type intramembrane protease [Chloroflexota bacterium]